MSLFIAIMLGGLGTRFGMRPQRRAVAAPGTPTGDGSMDFSIATGDNTALLALLEDI